MVTSGVNVSLNDQLARAGDLDHIKHLAAVRENFETRWVVWNVVRAVLHTAVFGCLLWALVIYGAHRMQETRHPASSAQRPLAAAYHGSAMHADPELAPGGQPGAPGGACEATAHPAGHVTAVGEVLTPMTAAMSGCWPGGSAGGWSAGALPGELGARLAAGRAAS
ncbi:anthrone oxygenase family protein [Streptomyces sp. NPDC004685]